MHPTLKIISLFKFHVGLPFFDIFHKGLQLHPFYNDLSFFFNFFFNLMIQSLLESKRFSSLCIYNFSLNVCLCVGVPIKLCNTFWQDAGMGCLKRKLDRGFFNPFIKLFSNSSIDDLNNPQSSDDLH